MAAFLGRRQNNSTLVAAPTHDSCAVLSALCQLSPPSVTSSPSYPQVARCVLLRSTNLTRNPSLSIARV